MFKNTYQNGFVSILYAGGSKPLAIWGQVVKNGHIRRVTDEDVQTMALEVMGTNVATTYIVCPSEPKTILGIKLPFFVMIVKNMKKYFSFEIQILGSCYLETLRVQIHANVRIRRIYFCDRLYSEDELPADFKLYVPITTQKKGKVGPKGAAGKDMKIVEDKSTGKDDRRVSKLSEKSEEKLPPQEVPSGALPTPREGSAVDMKMDKPDTFEEGIESRSPAGQYVEDEAYYEDEDIEFSLAPSAVDDEYVIETATDVGEGDTIVGGEETARTEAEAETADEATTDAEAPSTAEEA